MFRFAQHDSFSIYARGLIFQSLLQANDFRDSAVTTPLEQSNKKAKERSD